MTAISAWLPYVTVRAASRAMLESAVIDALREFCAETLVWQHEHDPISGASGVPDYDYSPPAGTEVVQPISAWYDTAPLVVRSIRELATIYGGTNWRLLKGTPRYVTSVNETQATLVPMPDSFRSLGLRMIVALKPTLTATTVDDVIYGRYREAIAHGARAVLKRMPDKDFSDEPGAEYCERLFRAKIAEAKMRAQAGFGPARLTAKNPFGRFA